MYKPGATRLSIFSHLGGYTERSQFDLLSYGSSYTIGSRNPGQISHLAYWLVFESIWSSFNADNLASALQPQNLHLSRRLPELTFASHVWHSTFSRSNPGTLLTSSCSSCAQSSFGHYSIFDLVWIYRATIVDDVLGRSQSIRASCLVVNADSIDRVNVEVYQYTLDSFHALNVSPSFSRVPLPSQSLPSQTHP